MDEEKKHIQQQNGGRKFKAIDWEKVDRLLEAGCPGTEIAPHFGVHYETLYDRAFTDHGIMWTEYSQQKRSKGDSNLRVKQYQEAMKGDKTLLIWLGKQRLDQKENREDNSNKYSKETLVEKFLGILDKMDDKKD